MSTYPDTILYRGALKRSVLVSIGRFSHSASAFRHHACGSLAASLAFFSLLSLFPMVFLLLYFISFIVSQDVIGYQFLLVFLKGFLPSSERVWRRKSGASPSWMKSDGSSFLPSCGSGRWYSMNWTTPLMPCSERPESVIL